jgi:hypothetical protein
MNSLRPVFALWLRPLHAFLCWQRTHMHPLSPYLPRLLVRINSLERRLS